MYVYVCGRQERRVKERKPRADTCGWTSVRGRATLSAMCNLPGRCDVDSADREGGGGEGRRKERGKEKRGVRGGRGGRGEKGEKEGRQDVGVQFKQFSNAR